MAKRGELTAALRKADAAGDTEGARRLATAIRRLDTVGSVEPFSGTVLKPGSAAPTDTAPELLRRPQDPAFYERAAEASRKDDTLANSLLRGAGQSLAKATRSVDKDFVGVVSDLGNIGAAGVQGAAALPVLAYDYLTKTKPAQIGEDVSRVVVEATGAGQLARLQNAGAINLPGAPRDVGATTYGQTGPDYDPALDEAGFGLGAVLTPTRATLGAMANPRSAGREAVAALQDAATNVTMGASDLVGAGIGAGRRGVNALTAPRPSPAPVTAVPPTAPRGPQGGPAGAGQQPPLNAVPAAPVLSKGQQRVARDTAKILGRIMRSSRIKDADIKGYLPGAIQRFKSLNDSRVPFAFFLERDLPDYFPGPIADEVTTKLRTWGRERNAATGPQDTSRKTTQETVKGLRESQQDFLTTEAKRNLYKGSLIGKEDQILRSLRETGRKGYEPTLAHARDVMEGRRVPTPDERQGFEQLRKVLQRPVFRDRIPNDVKLTAEAEGLDIMEMIERDPVTAAHWLQSNLRKLEDAAEDIGGKATPASLAYARMRDSVLEPLKKAAPGYEGAMKRYGHEFGAKEAVDFGRGLFTAARNVRDSAKLVRRFKSLTKRQQTVALMSIRDELLNQFRGTKEGAAAKITRLQEEGTLELLEELGVKGKRVADAIRKIARENEQIRAIDQGSGSPTHSNIEGARAAREIVQSPINKAVGAFGDKTSWPMTVAGDVVLASSGLPPVLSAGKAVTAAIDRFGNPSAKTLSRATEGLYGLPPPKPTNGLLSPPRGGGMGGRRRVSSGPPQSQGPQDIGALLKRLDEIESDPKLRGGPEGKRILDQIEKARAAPPSSGSPPVRAGFLPEKPKLDMSEPARMQRAREMGFDVDTPLYHGSPKNIHAFKAKADSGGTSGVYLTSDPKFAEMFAEGGAVYPVYSRGRIASISNADDLNKIAAEYEKLTGVSAANAIETIRSQSGKGELSWASRPAVEAAKRAGFDGVDLADSYGPSRLIFDPKNIRGKFAKFDPSQEGSSRILAGIARPGAAESAAGVGGYGYGYMNPRDADGDGDIDQTDRHLTGAGYGIGGMIGAGTARALLSKAPLNSGRSPVQSVFGGKGPPRKPPGEPAPQTPARGADQATMAAPARRPVPAPTSPARGGAGDDPFGDKAWAASKKAGTVREGAQASARPLDMEPPEKPWAGVRDMRDRNNRQSARYQLEELKVWKEDNLHRLTAEEMVDLDNEIEALENFSRTGNAEGVVDELAGADRVAAQRALRKLEAERSAASNPQFQADIDAEIAELREALGMPPVTVRPPPAAQSFLPRSKGPPRSGTNGLKTPPKPKAYSGLLGLNPEDIPTNVKPLTPAETVLRDTDREAIERLIRLKQSASADDIPEINAQLAALLKRQKTRKKPPPPVLSKEVQDFDARIKEAEKRFTADRRKFGRFLDQREPIYQAHMDEIADLKRQRAEALARDQAAKGVKKFVRQAYNAGPKIVAGGGLALAGGVVASSGIAAYNGLKGPPKKDDGPPRGRSAAPEDTRYRDNPARNSRNRQLVQQVQAQLNALGWRLRPDGVMLGSDGLHGAQTETQKAIRRFQYEVGLPVTGLLDADTIDAIDAAYREQLNRRASEARAPKEAYQAAQ